MRKLLFLSLLVVAFTAYSQNTSPFPATGNVGIGTLTPTEDLEVVGTIKSKQIEVNFGSTFTGNALNLTDGGNLKFVIQSNVLSGFSGFSHYDRNNKSRLSFASYDGAQSFLRLGDKTGFSVFGVQTNDTYGTYIHMPKPNSRIVVGDYGSYLFSDGHKLVIKDGSAMIEGNILTSNNIGIGTTSFVDGADTYRLSVEGKVRAHAVKVYTDWADYVFEDTYKLQTLEEVESYIKEHGHLRDIPSAKDVEENGIELGEINKLLLQKIEELTLYAIELKKEVDVLKAKTN